MIASTSDYVSVHLPANVVKNILRNHGVVRNQDGMWELPNGRTFWLLSEALENVLRKLAATNAEP